MKLLNGEQELVCVSNAILYDGFESRAATDTSAPEIDGISLFDPAAVITSTDRPHSGAMGTFYITNMRLVFDQLDGSTKTLLESFVLSDMFCQPSSSIVALADVYELWASVDTKKPLIPLSSFRVKDPLVFVDVITKSFRRLRFGFEFCGKDAVKRMVPILLHFTALNSPNNSFAIDQAYVQRTQAVDDGSVTAMMQDRCHILLSQVSERIQTDTQTQTPLFTVHCSHVNTYACTRLHPSLFEQYYESN
eukprot:m.142316 g.142316  ORF g.142316 m.142316 type:complete len:249 (+) comp14052_c1_seq8:157-903(+)